MPMTSVWLSAIFGDATRLVVRLEALERENETKETMDALVAGRVLVAKICTAIASEAQQ